jgi:hypothetical protein
MQDEKIRTFYRIEITRDGQSHPLGGVAYADLGDALDALAEAWGELVRENLHPRGCDSVDGNRLIESVNIVSFGIALRSRAELDDFGDYLEIPGTCEGVESLSFEIDDVEGFNREDLEECDLDDDEIDEKYIELRISNVPKRYKCYKLCEVVAELDSGHPIKIGVNRLGTLYAAHVG